MTNTSLHPQFDELIDLCLVSTNPGVTCEISQLYKENVYYLIHWTALQSGYNMNAAINVGNDDTYSLSIIDYFIKQLNQIFNIKLIKHNLTFNSLIHNKAYKC